MSFGVTIAYLVYLGMPLVLLVVGSVGRVWSNTLLPTGATLDWYVQLVQDGSFRRAFLVSLEVVGATCLACGAAGLPLAYAMHRSALRGVQVAVRIVSLLPVAVPPLVLGFGFILVFSSDALPWLGSLGLLIAGHTVLVLPYLVHTLTSDMRLLRLDAQELAAESLGAGFVRRFVDVVVPSMRHSLLSGLIMAAALSIGEFQLSNLIAGFLARPYPVVLLQAFYGATGFACAATVILLVLALLAAASGALLARTTSGAGGTAARLPA